MSLFSNKKMAIQKRGDVFGRHGVSTNLGKALLISVFGLSGSAFAQSTGAGDAPLTLQQVTKQSTETMKLDPTASQERDLRSRAMKEAAQSYGARSGLIRRSFEIRSAIEVAAGRLDAIWNFRPLMLTDAQPGERSGILRQRLIVPPVIVQAESIFKQDSPAMIRLVDKTYKLMSQPRFTSAPPSWREYLFRDLGDTNAVSLPHATLMPRNDAERKSWDLWVAEGWKSGVEQAESYYEYDLNRLHRDFDGMVTYHEMVAKNMVSLPFVATANEPISGDSNTMNINDSMLKITVLPAFQYNTNSWIPLQSGK